MSEDLPALGPCCMCDGTEKVTTIIMLERRCMVSGHGWGCAVCGLPLDGASAVLCDDCFVTYRSEPELLTTACRGYPATEGRIAIAELPPGTFDHDPVKHAIDDLGQAAADVQVIAHPPKRHAFAKPGREHTIQARAGFNWSAVNWGAPDQQRTDRCSYCGDPFPDDEEAGDFIPLILWSAEGWCAEFCDHCQAAWFGIQDFPDPPDEGPSDG